MKNLEQEEKGCVYFFRHIGLTPVKIGYSTHESPIDRFNQFKTYAPYGSELLGFISTKNAKELETHFHQRYSNRRLDGEWFEITIEDVKKEISFHSNIEYIRAKNDFEIAWAKKMSNKEEDVNIVVKNSNKDNFFKIYNYRLKNNLKINIAEIAKICNLSRQVCYRYLNE